MVDAVPVADSETTDPVAVLAQELLAGPAGEEAEALELLLDDEFEDIYPPLRESFMERLQPDALGSALHACPGCAYVCLDRYRPDLGDCRLCGAVMDPKKVAPFLGALTFGMKAEQDTSTRILPAPDAGWELEWELALDRSLARALELETTEEEKEEAQVDFVEKVQEILDKRNVEVQKAREEEERKAREEAEAKAREEAEAKARAEAEAKAREEAERKAREEAEATARAEAEAKAREEAERKAREEAEAKAREEAERKAREEAERKLREEEERKAREEAERKAREEEERRKVEAEKQAAERLRQDLGWLTSPAPVGAATALQEAGTALGLTILSGDLQGEVRSLQPGENRIGTGRSNDVVVRQRGVAFKHAVLHLHPDLSCEIEDLGAKGGVKVNGAPVLAKGRSALNRGDRIQLGDGPELLLDATPDAMALPTRARAVVPVTAADDLDEGPWVLRLESGKTHELGVGATRVGAARSNQLQIKARGISFKHAVLHLNLLGTCEVEDLGTKGGTSVNDLPLAPKATHPLRKGDRIRFGSSELQILGAPAPDAAAATDEPAVHVGDPEVLLEVLPPNLIDLAQAAGRAIPVAHLLEDQTGDDRIHLERDAADFVELARGVLASRHLPEPSTSWLLFDEQQEQFLARSTLSNGLTVVLRCWDMLARLPTPVDAGGPNRTTGVMKQLVAQELGRLLPVESEETQHEFWRCVYSSPQKGLLNQRFERIEALSNGQVVGASFFPRFSIDHIIHDRAQDPISQAIKDQNGRLAWRPGPNSIGPPPPPHPSGGRYGRRRHQPTRSKNPRRPWKKIR